jgi:hypothetical protein
MLLAARRQVLLRKLQSLLRAPLAHQLDQALLLQVERKLVLLLQDLRARAPLRRSAEGRRGGPARLSSPSWLAQAHVVILRRNPGLEISPLTGPHGHAGRARAAAEQQRPPGRCSLGRQLLAGRRGAAALRPGGAVGTCKAGMLGWRAGQASSVG